MESSEIKIVLIDFFIKIVKSDIFIFNKNELLSNRDKIKNGIERNKILATFYVQTSRSKDHKNLTKDDRIILYWLPLQIIVATLELSKLFLKNIVSSELLNGATTYGQVVGRICQKIGLSSEEKNKLFDLLYVNFRNSIAHEDYELDETGITIFTKNIKYLETMGVRNSLQEVQMMLKILQSFMIAIANVNKNLGKQVIKEKYIEEIVIELERIKTG